MTEPEKPKQRAERTVEEATAVALTSQNPAFRARMLEMVAKMQAMLDRAHNKPDQET